MKKTILLLNAILLAALSAVEISDAVLARVSDKVITAFDVRVASQQQESTLPHTLTQEQRMLEIAKIREAQLDELITNELVWLDFLEMKAKVPQHIVQERIDRVIRSAANSNEERFRDLLHAQNTTYQEFEEDIRKQIAVEMLLYDKTQRNIFITTSQIQNYFNEHVNEFATPAKYHIQAIMLKKADATQETLNEIRTLLSNGEDFASVARKYSQGANAAEGGDLGWMDALAPSLEKCVVALKQGETATEGLEIGNGIYIVKLLEKQGGGKAELTAEIKKQIKKTLEDAESQKRREEYIKSLYMKYPVRKY
ncbi:MAG: peptidylprolyl isomerase [Lentisphaeria bacterium]|nr:peptidylprolyl isomerase [Lentisphaeria bacterium]